MLFTHEHEELQRQLRKFIDAEINPFVDEWEEAEIFRRTRYSRKWGNSASSACASRWNTAGSPGLFLLGRDGRGAGPIQCGGIPMAIGVQTDMATPALARFRLGRAAPRISRALDRGGFRRLPGRVRSRSRVDVASIMTTARKDGDDYIINGGKM